MAIDFLDGIKAERDEQKRRYVKTFTEALTLGKLTETEQAEFDRLDDQVSNLNKNCRQKEIDLEPLRSQDHEEYVTEMVELCDYEAKTFARITGDMRKLIRKINRRRGRSLSKRW